MSDDAIRGDTAVYLTGSSWINGLKFLKSPVNDCPVEPNNLSNVNMEELKQSAKFDAKIDLYSYLIHLDIICINKPVSANPSRFTNSCVCYVSKSAR
jgi:hypothetical protein